MENPTPNHLNGQIRRELEKNFKVIDEEVLNYLISVIDLNKEDFSTVEDIEEAVGAILGELSNGENDEEFIYELCSKLFNILKQSVPGADFKENTSNYDEDGDLKQLSAPITISNWLDESDKTTPKESESVFEIRSYVDSKKLEKAEAKLKQKTEKRENKQSNAPAYDASKSASASQAISRKTENATDSNRTFDVIIENFDISFGNKTLLSGANLTLAFGRRYCLIGRNGIGKTTLLTMISSGQLKIPSHIRILHVEQEVVGDDTTAINSVLECDLKRQSLLQQEKELNEKIHSSETKDDAQELSAKLAKVYIELEAIEADKALSRAAKILCGLGFSPADQKKATKEFSGGWRMRLALARALFAK